MTPDDYECRSCHAGMYVPDGMDPLDEDVRYCESCAIDEIERLRAENALLRAELKRRTDLEPSGHVLDDDLRKAGVTR